MPQGHPQQKCGVSADPPRRDSERTVYTSAVTGAGIGELRAAIGDVLGRIERQADPAGAANA